MPCYTISYVSVKIKAENLDFLKLALKDLGYTYNVVKGRTKVNHRIVANNIDLVSVLDQQGREVMLINMDKQRIKVKRNEEGLVNELNRAYAKAVVTEVAKRNRWVVKQQDKRKLLLRRY